MPDTDCNAPETLFRTGETLFLSGHCAVLNRYGENQWRRPGGSGCCCGAEASLSSPGCAVSPAASTAARPVAALVVLAALTWLRAESPWIVTELQERTFDAYQRLQPREHGDFPVRIVDIDEASIAAYGQWPWPRTRLAAISNRLTELGAGATAYAMIFAEPDRTTPKRIASELQGSDVPNRDTTIALLASLPDHDQLFADAMRKTNAVLGFASGRSQNGMRPAAKAGLAFVGVKPTEVLTPFRGAVANLPVLEEAAAGVGGINLSSRDRSGVIRRIPMLFSDGERIYPGLAAEALRVAQGQKGIVVRGTGASGETDSGHAALLDMRVGDFRIPLTDDGETWLYYNRDRPDRYVSVKDLLDPAKEAEVRPRIEGSIVLVGTSAAGLIDARATPLGQIMPGVAVHAQLIEQILADNFISRPDWANGLEIIVTVLLAVFVAVMLVSFGARFSLIAGVIALVLAVAGSWFAFSHFRAADRPDLSLARRGHDVHRHGADAARGLRQGEEVRPPGIWTISRPGTAGAAGGFATGDATRRRGARAHRDVHGRARLHVDLRDAVGDRTGGFHQHAAGAVVGSDPERTRHHRQVHRRFDHGFLERAARYRRSRHACLSRGVEDARGGQAAERG